jgi:hypothetical protein
MAVDGTIAPLAGTGSRGFSGDGGTATRARLDAPSALAVSAGGLLIADTGNRIVRRVDGAGNIETVAGRSPDVISAGTPAEELDLEAPRGVAALSDGSIIVGDVDRVWRVDTDGSVRPVLGTGRSGFNISSGDALATRVDHTSQIATGPADALFVADTLNDRIRRVLTTREATTVAGSDRPNVPLAPVALAPFTAERPQGPVSRRQRRRGYRPRHAARPAPARSLPSCARGATTATELKIRPYTRRIIRSAVRPVIVQFGISVDATVTAYAWRDRHRYARVSRVAPAGRRAIRLRGRLRPGRYVAVLIGRAAGGIRLCDGRRLRVRR